MTNKDRIYLDYAASTPVDPRVVKAMQPYFTEIYGNPHALHSFGQEASRAVFESKRVIGQAIGADYKELVFTGSATEANNLAIRGAVKSYKLKVKSSGKPRIITTTIEHESILETCRGLEKEGVEVIYIPVNRDGLVDLKKLEAALNDRTVLVSVMMANNEVGTIQPISEISSIIKNWKLKIKNSAYPLFHTDAVQAFQYLDCNVNELGVDLMTLSAHKIYGPKGIGALYVRGHRAKGLGFSGEQPKGSLAPIGYWLHPIITGSGQEFGLRSGTDNVPYIVGFAKAVELSMAMQNRESKRVGELRDYFWKELQKIKVVPRQARKILVPERSRGASMQLNGSMKYRLPNNLNIYFPGKSAQELLIKLDLAGASVSPGAACSTRTSKASFVLEAMGFSEDRASQSLRFSFGRQTTQAEIDRAAKILVTAILSK
ncbi:MAG: cysteine desulfurase [Parcubacteria group bacterium Gr01-1014_3]|nr:MAG: cysteine desulfurase [Parcubacteria group bacterium Gr01-1014_3]